MNPLTAIVVARGGSVRLPNKALLPFAGTSLIGNKVRQLRQCRSVGTVVVGSDSLAILEAAAVEGAVVLLRDAYHCDESRCPANDMLADMAGKVEGEHVLWAHPTNPLVRPETYDAAASAYFDALSAGYDSLVSVTRIRRHAWVDGKPWNYDPWTPPHPVASKLKAVDFQDGAIFIQRREQMIRGRYFFGTRPVLFPVSAVEGWDIDTREDYDNARLLAGEPDEELAEHVRWLESQTGSG